jgi:hypothetical protein
MGEDIKNVVNEWDRLAIFARRSGGLFPGSGIAVKSSNNETVIRPSRSRWLRSIHFFAVALFLLGPILIAYFVIPETSPERYGLLVVAIFPAVGGLLLLRKGLLYSLRVGKITFSRDSSELTIHYGYLPFTKTLCVRRDNISVKTYIFKSPHKGTRFKYGQTILSLARTDQEESELIIGAVNNNSSVLAAFETLRSYLGRGSPEEPEIETKVETWDSPFDIESKEWDRLVKKSKSWNPFFGSIGMKVFCIRSSPYKIVLKWNWVRLVTALLIIGFSGFMLYGTFYIFDLNVFKIILCSLSFIMGSALLLLGTSLLLDANKLILDEWNSMITIRYGYFPLSKILTIPAEQVEARIYRYDEAVANRVLKLGYTILSLNKKNQKDSELIIAAASKKSILMPAYKRLAEFLKQSIEDGTIEELELPNSKKISIPTTAMTTGEDPDQNKRTLCFFANEQAVFTKRTRNTTIWILSVGMGLFFLIGVFFIVEDWMNDIHLFVLAIPIGCFMSGVGIYNLIKFWRERYLIANTTNGTISFKSLLRRRNSRPICGFSDIATIQICSQLARIPSGRSSREACIYEINFVLSTPPSKRINISCSEDKEQIYTDAEKFAEFLGVPLLDHT